MSRYPRERRRHATHVRCINHDTNERGEFTLCGRPVGAFTLTGRLDVPYYRPDGVDCELCRRRSTKAQRGES